MYDLLKGTRVLDLTSVVLGPFATQHLGDLGADVIKIEPLSGDIFRTVQPARSRGMGVGHLGFNRNKRSIALNLKDDKHRKRFDALLKDADVMVHNMRPAATKRLGINPEKLCETYPRLVYCLSTGYGSGGSNADLPAYDDIIQAASGVAHLNQDKSGEPRYLPTILCDKIGGLHLAMAVLAGLVQQERTGRGCVIEAPMFEGLTSFMLAEHLAGETFRPPEGPMGYSRILSEHRKPFRTKDGFIGVLPYNGEHWASFLELVGRHDLAEAEWVKHPSQRSSRVSELYAVIDKVMPDRSSADWIDALRARDIPCTKVNSFEDLLNDRHLGEVGLFTDVEHPTEGPLRALRSPFWVNGGKTRPDLPAPPLGSPEMEITWLDRV